MEILVDNKSRVLELIDPKTGADMAPDLIGNADGFTGNIDGMDTMTGDQYIWWLEYIKAEDDILLDTELVAMKSDIQKQLEQQGWAFRGQEPMRNHERDMSKICYCGRPNK